MEARKASKQYNYSNIWEKIAEILFKYAKYRGCIKVHKLRINWRKYVVWEHMLLKKTRKFQFFLVFYIKSQIRCPISFYTPVFRQDVLWYGEVRPSESPSVRPSDSPSGSPSARFPHFSPTCFDILSWNFAHDLLLLYYRASSNVVTLRQFLKELCLFVNLEYR